MISFSQGMALLSLVSNIITICVFTIQKIKHDFKRTYTFMIIYTVFNSLYILIMFTRLICHSDLFACYPYTSSFIYIQFTKLILIRLVGSILKTASNIAFTSFTLARYLAITMRKYKILIFLDKISIKKHLAANIIFSVFINVYVYFIAVTDPISYPQMKLFSPSNYSPAYFQDVDDYKEDLTSFSHNILNVFQIIRIFFSDTFYIILVTLIDVSLLNFIRLQTKKKTEMCFNVLTAGLQEDSKKKRKYQRKLKASEKRLSSMIILNGCNFLMLKLPSAVISLYGFIYIYNIDKLIYEPDLYSVFVCRELKVCENVAQLAHLLYLLSFQIQFLILLKLDKNFKQNWDLLKSLIKQAIMNM